jgi:hypothetical protein
MDMWGFGTCRRNKCFENLLGCLLGMESSDICRFLSSGQTQIYSIDVFIRLAIQDWAECLFGSLGTMLSIENDDAVRLDHMSQRADDANLLIVGRLTIGNDIDRLAVLLSGLMDRTPMKFGHRRFVIHDHQQIMIAARPRITARARAEQDHLARVEVVDHRLQQSGRDFGR